MPSIRFDNPEAPVASLLSFQPLIRYLRSQHADGDVSPIDAMLHEVPEFEEPIRDYDLLERHPRVMAALMDQLFPPIYREREMVCAMLPFADRPFFASPRFRDLLLDTDGRLRGALTMDSGQLAKVKRLATYLAILDAHYGIHEDLRLPIVRRITDPQSGLDRYFDIKLDYRFMDVLARQEPAALSADQRASIRHCLDDEAQLVRLIRPENFELHGFIVHSAVEVTATSIVSELERDLIDRLTLLSEAGFTRIQNLLRALFRKPGLIAGISALRDDQIMLVNTGSTMVGHCIFQSSRHLPVTTFDGTPWAEAVDRRHTVLVRDVVDVFQTRSDGRTLFPPEARSMMISPLIYQDAVIGLLTVSDPEPDAFVGLDTFQAAQLQPLFAVAVKKALNDLEMQVQGIIKEKCTAIHPSVEWRFRQAAYRLLDDMHNGVDADIEPIVFKNVYALFGVCDIRGSTDQRNRAIQADLETHLDLALGVIRTAAASGGLMILDELAARIRTRTEDLRAGLSSDDETRVAELMQHEVEPLFDHLATLGPDVQAAIGRYRAALDPQTGDVYRLRRDFDESVTRLNSRLAAYLDSEDARMQRVFGHYFEKHRTDGVDYLIYVGQSLMETGRFSDLYLRDIRLWQIRLAAGMAWHTRRLADRLPVPLETAHLVLMQNTPTAIRFRYDEKRFDVDGAYDVRNEIIRSRLDKAMVKGGGERLTQPGKIAVVFSHPDEGTEIRRYIDFLASQGILTGETEELELENMPGVHGLRALRPTVNLDTDAFAEPGDPAAVDSAA